MSTASRLATAMRYRDVPSAADWLCSAFGFEKQTVAVGETGTVHYAQLTFGSGMLMLAPVRETTADRFMKQPDEIGGAETQSCYFVVADADAHYARAKAAGAEIILELQEDDFGGRGYSCRDPEGHIWSFGTHDPWQGKQPPGDPRSGQAAGASRARRWGVAAVLAVLVASAAGAAWIGGALRQPSAVSSTARQVQDEGALERAAAETEQLAREVAERAAREAREALEVERAAKAAAERASREAQNRAVESQRAKEAAETAAREVREQLDRERAAKVAVERANEEAQKRVAEALSARQAAEHAAEIAGRALEQARKRVAEEQGAREAAERAAKSTEQAARASEPALKTAAPQADQAPQKLLAEERGAKEAAERAAEAAARALEEAQKRVAEAQNAREAAERTAKEAREQLSREQSSKNAAWRANAQLRRQLSQVLSANQATSEASSSEEATPPVTKSAKARPKRQQKKAPEADGDD